MRRNLRNQSAGAGSRTRTIPKPRFAFFLNRSTKQTPTPRERPSVRERGRSDRTSALTAWEDGGSAVLQADTARRGLATCGGWRSHASDRTTTCCSPTPSPPPRPRCSCLAQRLARERGDGSPRRCRTRSNHARRPERDRLSLRRACRARSVSPGQRPGLPPSMSPGPVGAVHRGREQRALKRCAVRNQRG